MKVHATQQYSYDVHHSWCDLKNHIWFKRVFEKHHSSVSHSINYVLIANNRKMGYLHNSPKF